MRRGSAHAMHPTRSYLAGAQHRHGAPRFQRVPAACGGMGHTCMGAALAHAGQAQLRMLRTCAGSRHAGCCPSGGPKLQYCCINADEAQLRIYHNQRVCTCAGSRHVSCRQSGGAAPPWHRARSAGRRAAETRAAGVWVGCGPGMQVGLILGVAGGGLQGLKLQRMHSCEHEEMPSISAPDAGRCAAGKLRLRLAAVHRAPASAWGAVSAYDGMHTNLGCYTSPHIPASRLGCGCR